MSESLVRLQSVVSYSSSSGGQTYTFDVVIDAQGLVTIRNVLGPRGVPCTTGIPESVLLDMQEAKELTLLLLDEAEVASGTLVFTGQTELPVAIGAGVLNNTQYRVLFTGNCASSLSAENKTLTGFDAVAGAALGTVADPVSVDYAVLVSTAASSTYSGTVTFTVADAGSVNVVFASPLDTAAYRIILSPDGFFAARVINKTTAGFTIELGHLLTGIETVTVGFDLFA